MRHATIHFILSVWALSAAAMASAELATQNFDTDPGWAGANNRVGTPPREVVQDFGYAADGRIGGIISPDGSPAYYATPIPEASFGSPLAASGVMRVEQGAGNTLVGFFNSNTVNEWRTPNSIVWRINGRGEFFHVHFEYATSKWRAGAGVIGRVDLVADRVYPLELPAGQAYPWSLHYDPAGNNGGGVITATFGETTATCNLTEGHHEDGATFNRFGILNTLKSVDAPGSLWMKDLELLGNPVDLSVDPAWEGLRNRETYLSTEVRARFDFGYSATNHAGGKATGEIGGLFYRGDCRYPDKLAYYGAELQPLTLDKPLRAAGRVVMRQGVSDSTTFFGFFHDQHSMRVHDSQRSQRPADFIGVAVEGPSSQGFYLYPVWRGHEDFESEGSYEMAPPHIYPDGVSHTWELEYTPPNNALPGALTLQMDGQACSIPIPAEALEANAQFNRFGFITGWIDGNGQRVYLDDLTYTSVQ